MILSSIPYGRLKLDQLLERKMQNEFNAEKNSKKTDEQLALDFVNAEKSRQANEAMHLLGRLLGEEPSYMGCSPSRN